MSDSTFRTVWLHQQLDRWQGGDDAARDDLLRAVGMRLELLARKMLRGFPTVRRHADTGDVFQNAVLRLLRALGAVRPQSTRDFFGLAAVQIRRELLDMARQVCRQGEPTPLTPVGASTTAVGNDPPAPNDSVELERWATFHQEVEKLPAEEREVMGLVFYHGWTQVEVAELFQVDERTIRRWWQSALLKLRERLKGELPAQ